MPFIALTKPAFIVCKLLSSRSRCRAHLPRTSQGTLAGRLTRRNSSRHPPALFSSLAPALKSTCTSRRMMFAHDKGIVARPT